METKHNATNLITGLMVRHMNFNLHHFCDGSAVKSHSSIGYVVRGGSHLVTDNITLDLKSGDCFYLPVGIRYRSDWTGFDDIEYYIIHVSTLSDRAGTLYSASLLRELSTPETLTVIKSIAADLDGDLTKQFAAVSRFYDLYAKAIPYLTPVSKSKRNPVLTMAIQYIREHYLEDFTIAELAANCMISESRLYHIFKEEMSISPIQFRNEIRINKAISMMHSGARLKEIILSTGFNSSAYFRKTFQEYTGLAPKEYRKAIMEK